MNDMDVKTASSANSSFKALSREEFDRRWKKGQLTDLWLGGANSVTVDDKVRDYLTRAANKASAELKDANLSRAAKAKYCQDHGLKPEEFDRFLEAANNPADYAYEFMHLDNIRMQGKGRPNNHFSINGSRTRYYV